MKIVCVCDYFIDKKLQEKYKELEQYGVEVDIVENPDLIENKDSCMDVMFQTEKNGAEAVVCNEDVIHAIKDADVAIVHITPINKAVIDQCPNLKVLGVMRGGVDSVNVEYLREKGVTVVNAPTRSAHAVADFTVGMILSEVNNIAKSYHGIMEGRWIKEYANNDNVHDLRTRKVGIVGCGNIGREVIKRLQAFGCDIIVYDPYVDSDTVESMGYHAVTKDELLEQSDIISMHLRLSDETKNFFGEKEFKKMKKDCVFINTARAGLVDQKAMLEALKENRISGAAVDVFEEEPLPKENEYIKLNNITMTSHIAGTSCDTFRNSVDLIFEEVKRYLHGEKPICVV